MSTAEYEILSGERLIPEDEQKKDTTYEDEESVEVNGFEDLPSQEKLVKELFNQYPDLTSTFDLKIQQFKNFYMKIHFDLFNSLCQSTNELSWKDLNKADSALIDLTIRGFNVDWLCEELDILKKEKQILTEIRIRHLEEKIKKQTLTLSNLESDLEKEKAAAIN